MPLFDLPLEQLRDYLPERDEPADFDDFWSATLAEAREFAGRRDVHPVRRSVHQCRGVRRLLRRVGRPPDQRLVPDCRAAPKGRCPASCTTSATAAAAASRTTTSSGRRPGYAVFVMETRGQGGANAAAPASPATRTAAPPAGARHDDPRHPRPRRLLLPAGLHRRGTGRGRGRRASRRGRRARSSSPAAARAAASPRRRRPAPRRAGRADRRAVPDALPAGRGDHRRGPVPGDRPLPGDPARTPPSRCSARCPTSTASTSPPAARCRRCTRWR